MSGEQFQPPADRASDLPHQPVPPVGTSNPPKRYQKFAEKYSAYGIILAYVALGVGLISTYIGFVFTSNVNHAHAQQALERRKEEITAHLDKQLSLYLNALQGFKGLYAASKSVERDEFNAYANGIRLSRNFPGLLAVEYVQRVESSAIESFVSQVRSDTSLRPEGYPAFHVFPEGSRPEYFPVTFIETSQSDPWASMGYDACFDPNRRAVAEAARDSREPAASGLETLVFDHKDPKPAFLVYVPIYKKHAPRDTVVQRHDALEGYIVGAFRTKELFTILLSSLGDTRDVDLEIFDGPEPSPKSLLFDSNQARLDSVAPLGGQFRSVSDLAFGGRTWLLVVHASSQYGLNRFERLLPLGALIFGLLLSIMGFLVIYGLATAQSRAVSLASRMSAEARSSETYFRALIKHAQDVVTIIEANGVIRFESPAIERVLGYTPDELIGKNAFDYIHPDDRAKTFATVASAVPFPGSARKATFRYRHKGGDWRTLESIGTNQLFDPAVRGFVINSRDVTEREEAQRLIEEIAARFSGLVSNIPGAVYRCICDAQWTMEFISQAIETISGYPAQEFMDKRRSYVSLICPEDRLTVERTVLDSVERNEPYSLEYRIAHADGSYRWVEMHGRGSFKEQGRVFYLDGVIFDVTKRRESEERLREANENLKNTQAQLFQSEKLASIGQLAAGVAHEVKNPLAIILQGVGYFELLPGVNEGESREIVDMMRKAIQRADRIIRELLDFARPATAVTAAVAVQPLVESSLELVKAQLRGSQITVSMDMEPGLPAVNVDENQMRQVLVNLILNAFQAMPKGGELKIRAHVQAVTEHDLARSHRLASQWQKARPGVWIEIADTGAGIPKHLINRIWDPFFTTKPAGQGTGLGLSVTQSILEAHQGLLFIESEEGKGTKAVIVLPVEGGKYG